MCKGVASMSYGQIGVHVWHVSACVHVCESLWYCSPCYCGVDGHSPFFKCQATRWAIQCTWVCLAGCLGNDLTSPSLLIGPGVQVLPLRVMDADQGNDLGIHGIFPEGYAEI